MTFGSVEFRRSRTTYNVAGDEVFRAMRAAHQEALHAEPCEVSTSDFALAGAAAHMNIAGRDLARSICRPFRHLFNAEDVENPQLTVELWDEHATGVACPERIREIEEDARIDGEEDFAITVGTVQDRHVGHLRPGIRVWIDRKAAYVIGCVEDSARLSILDRGRPLHFPLLLWHADRRIPVVHAAFASYRGRGVLFVGKGGTGKTTAVLSCLFGGFFFLADDYVGLQRTESGLFVGHSLYDSAWLTADGEALFFHLAHHAEPPERLGPEARWLVRIHDVAPDRLIQSATICAVLLTALSDNEPCLIRSVPKAAALLALAPSSMLRLPVSGKVVLDRMSKLVEQVPTYQLDVGRDLSSLPLIVRRLLAEEDSL